MCSVIFIFPTLCVGMVSFGLAVKVLRAVVLRFCRVEFDVHSVGCNALALYQGAPDGR